MLEIFSRLGIALGLGLLVGLQRQRTDSRLAGIRTFPLVTLFGALCGMLAENFGGWTVAAGMGALALIILGGNFPLLRAEEERPGVTTEVTMLVMFGLGAYAMVGSLAITIATCGAVVVLLHLKPQMHSIAQKIGDRDFTAIMQFTLISLVILPVLPNRVYGPFEVLNPFKIWLMVVLIVGISLGGYVAYKVIGVRGGAWVSGVLGGLISSTATTVSVARRSKESPGRPELAGFVIIIASAIVFLRVGILVGVTAPQFLRAALFPLLAMFTVLALLGWASLRHHGNGSGALPEQTNPTELKPALLFGLLYAVVLLAAAAAYQYFGRQGLYVTAIISGLTDMDAITLSVTHLVNAAEIPAGTGWRVILGAAMANLAFKTATVAMLGEQRLLTRVAGVFGAAGVIGLALLFFGPQ